MAYSSIVKPSVHFNTKLYTGNGGTNAITGVGFQPDWVWLKDRDTTDWHFLTDAVRGVTKTLHSNTTTAETTQAGALTAFGSDGFTVGNDGSVNRNNENFVSWNWKANGTGSANTDGSINTTATSVNTTAGFSISTYTGDNNDGATIGHGLGVIPSMVIVKKLSSTRDFMVKHKDLTSNYNIALNTSDAQWQPSSNGWISDLTSNQTIGFSIGSSDIDNVNQGGQTFVAYCFAEKKGYSKFGEYGGNNNADGTFVYTGFKPAFVMLKRKDAVADWVMKDNRRPGYNVTDDILYPNGDYAEGSGGDIDIVSNGFKIRTTADNTNGNDGNPYYYIYMAFAEAPLVANSGANGVPATAR